jgi:hypothetical protein
MSYQAESDTYYRPEPVGIVSKIKFDIERLAKNFLAKRLLKLRG